MKFSIILPLAAVTTLSSAFVLPDETVFSKINAPDQAPIVPDSKPVKSVIEKVSSAVSAFTEPCSKNHKKSKHAFAGARTLKSEEGTIPGTFYDLDDMTAFNAKAFLKSSKYQVEDISEWDALSVYQSRHHKKGKYAKKVKSEDHDGDADDKPKHPPPHHGGAHHHKPNETIWQLISKSKYTTKLAKLIGEYDDLVDILNGTASNYTLFAPTDSAFEKIGRHHGNHSDHKPSKELIKKVLTYHVSPDFYPAGRVLVSHTIPSALEVDELGGPQRLRVGLGLKGLAVNFYSRIVAIDIFGTNGVIHGIDSVLLPPPSVAKIISLLPATFSTFELAIHVTNLTDSLPEEHVGGTLFAPSNNAFERLGPRLNAFLFSRYGVKYLKALLEYHIVVNQTLYSDAYYHPELEQGTLGVARATGIPKGRYHVDLPTLLKGKHLSIDIGRFGGLIDITINGYVKVAVQDGIAKDGVIQVVRNVLIPPKKPGEGLAEEVTEEMTVEEFKSRFDGIVEEDNEADAEEDVDMDRFWHEEEFMSIWEH